MAVDKDKKPLDGFDVLGDFLVGPRGGIIDPTNDVNDGNYQDIDPDDLQKKLVDNKDIKDKDDVDVDDVDTDDDSDSTDDNKPDDVDDKDGDDTDNKTDDDKEYETEVSSYFASELVKKLGLDDDFKDSKFNTIDDVLELMGDIIEDNSKPTYASEEVEAFDEFVKNGGNLRNFYDEVYSGKLDLDAVDIEREYDQRAIVRENLLNQGYKEERIKKIIGRYEESETLKEEAEDALDLLKEFNKKKQDSLLEKQKNDAEEMRKQQQKFFNDVNSTIKNISDFRGFPISEREKRELLQYAFVPDDDGLTKYQKDVRSDVYNLLEAAFFAKNRDKVKASKISSKDTESFKTLRDKLKARSNKVVDDDNDNSKGKGSRGSLGDIGKGIFY